MTKELTKKVKKSTAISGNTNKTLSSITPEKIAENTKKLKKENHSTHFALHADPEKVQEFVLKYRDELLNNRALS